MPKVPQILASGETGGSSLVRASPALADYSGVQQAVGELGKAAQLFTRADKVVADENAKLEAEMALGEVQRQFADAESKLKLDPTVTPDDYSKQVDEALRSIRQGVSRTLQRPEARLAFERGSEQFFTKKSIEGKHEGLAMRVAQMTANTDTLIRGDVNLAINAETPELRDQAERRALGRVDGMLAVRGLTPAAANARRAAILADVEEGRVKLDAADPRFRTDIIEHLMNGRLRYMRPDVQRDLAGRLMREAEAIQTKQDGELAHQIEADKQQAMTAFTQAALKEGAERRSPQELLQWLDNLTGWHKIKDTEYQRLHKLIALPDSKNAPGAARESDPATLRLVIADTHSMRPRLSENDLHGFFDRGLLTEKDWTKALDRRRETLESNRREGQSLVMQQHGQAEQELAKHVGIVTPFSVLEGTAAKLWPEVLTELRRRSNAYPGGKESPITVLEELIPRVRNTLSRDAALTIKELENLLTYKTGTELTEAKRQGKISDGFFRSEQDRLKRLGEARKRKEANDEKTNAQQGGAKPPSGGTNPFGRPK